MKKTFLFIAVICLIASDAVAQLEKGNLMFGVTSTFTLMGGWGSELGSLGFSNTKHNDGTTTEDAYKQTTYNLLPKTGYFIIDNLVAGLEVIVSGYTEENADYEGKWSESIFGIGPFVRYYYPLEKIYPFVEVDAVFGTYKYKWPDSGGGYEEVKNGLFMFGGFLGAALPLGEKVTLDLLAGYIRSSINFLAEDNGESVDYQEITGGVGIKVGFSVYLPLK